LGNFFIQKNPNEPTKSSLTVEKFAQSGHPSPVLITFSRVSVDYLCYWLR
jgi:hypothetical protein